MAATVIVLDYGLIPHLPFIWEENGHGGFSMPR